MHDFLLSMPGTVWDYKAEWGWDRYRVGEKMFAALCRPGLEHAAEYAGHPLLTLKCEPLEAELLRGQYPDILPGFYMDKRNWISIRLDGAVPQDLIQQLCVKSYRRVLQTLSKKRQKEIAGSL